VSARFPHLIARLPSAQSQELLTQHISLLVLSSLQIGNVGLQTQVDRGQVLDGISLWLQSANEPKPFPRMNFIAKVVQVSFQCGEQEVLSANEIAIQAEFYSFFCCVSGLSTAIYDGLAIVTHS